MLCPTPHSDRGRGARSLLLDQPRSLHKQPHKDTTKALSGFWPMVQPRIPPATNTKMTDELQQKNMLIHSWICKKKKENAWYQKHKGRNPSPGTEDVIALAGVDGSTGAGNGLTCSGVSNVRGFACVRTVSKGELTGVSWWLSGSRIWHCHCLRLWSLLWYRFHSWPRNVHMPWISEHLNNEIIVTN